MSFLQKFSPSVIIAVFLWNLVLYLSEFGKISKAEILFAL